MKKIIFFFALAAIIFMQVKCKPAAECCMPEPTGGTVVFNFKAQYDNAPLVMYKTYMLNGKKIQFSGINFLITKVCPAAKLDCLARSINVDFSGHTDSIKAARGTSDTLAIEGGTYASLTFGIGVDSVDNKKSPKDFVATTALGDVQNYWYGWNGYIFLKIHGVMDVDGDGKFETPVTLDTGSDACYRSFGVSKNITLNTTPTVFSFQLNVNKLLQGYDIVKTPSTQTFSELPQMNFLMTNLQNAISTN